MTKPPDIGSQVVACNCSLTAGHAPNCPFFSGVTQSAPPITITPLGWKCPACGGGVAPGVERCPCVPVVTLNSIPLVEFTWKWSGKDMPPISPEPQP